MIAAAGDRLCRRDEREAGSEIFPHPGPRIFGHSQPLDGAGVRAREQRPVSTALECVRRVVDAFAAYVHNPDLTPWLPVGSLIYIDPSKPLRPSDFVLVKSGRIGRIAIYRGRTPDSIVLSTGDGQDEEVAISTLAGFWKIVSVEYP